MAASTGIRRERQQRTRERLLAAAERVFARHGFSGASVPQIAEDAGVSTGAIYSNFTGKEELFLAMMSRIAEEGARSREAALTAGSEDRHDLVSRMADDWVGTVDQHPDVVLLMVEFWLYAVRRPQMRDLVAEFLADVRGNFEDLVATFGGHQGSERHGLAVAIQALAYGFAMQRLTDEEVTAEDFTRALQWLFAGAEAPRDA